MLSDPNKESCLPPAASCVACCCWRSLAIAGRCMNSTSSSRVDKTEDQLISRLLHFRPREKRISSLFRVLVFLRTPTEFFQLYVKFYRPSKNIVNFPSFLSSPPSSYFFFVFLFLFLLVAGLLVRVRVKGYRCFGSLFCPQIPKLEQTEEEERSSFS